MLQKAGTMLKWGRRYRLVFEIGIRKNFTEYIPQETIEVKYPTTLRLNISNGINFSSVSQASLQLYNLSRDVQARLWKDNFDQQKYVTVWVYAGYQTAQMPLIFLGDVLECYSYREEGGVDFITDIKCSDGSYLFQYGIANFTFAKGTKTKNLLEALLADNPAYKVGYISPSLLPLQHDETYIGQTMDLIGRKFSGYEIFIDKREINILKDNEVVPSDIQVITAESGLLGSPRRSDLYLECTTIFEPGLKIGQAVEVISDSLPWVNNVYRITGLTHNGIISPVQSGKLTTKLQFNLGKQAFDSLRKEANEYTETTDTTWSKPVNGKITSYFGPRKRPVKGASTYHLGIDIGAPNGTPVLAPTNGRVSWFGWNGGYGRYIEVDHGTINGKRVSSYYGHLSGYAIASNQQVYKGQTVLGYVGSTGTSSGNHLHFGVKENGKAVDPLKYLGNLYG